MNGTLSGDYFLKFIVKDEIRQEEARANATITIKEISEKAVTSSGSIRMKNLSEEDFVSVWDSKVWKDVIYFGSI